MPRKTKRKENLPVNPNPDRTPIGTRFKASVWTRDRVLKEKVLTYKGTRPAGSGFLYIAEDDDGKEYYFHGGAWCEQR